MYVTEEKRVLMPPQDMMHVVNRIANGVRKLMYVREKGKFKIGNVEVAVSEAADAQDQIPPAEKPKKRDVHRIEHFVSWILLASVYYENMGMLINIIDEVKKHPDAKILFNNDKIKYFKELRIGHVPEKNDSWYAYERNLLFWSIVVTNNPAITEILYQQGGSIENHSSDDIPYFLTQHVFSPSLTGNVSLFSLSKEEFKQAYEEEASRKENVELAVPFEKWLEDRIQIIKLAIKYEHPQKTFMRKNFKKCINEMHPDYADVQKELNMLVFFASKKYDKECLKSDYIKTTLAAKHEQFELLTTFKFSPDSPLLQLYNQLRKILTKEDGSTEVALNDIILELYNFKFLQEYLDEDFLKFIIERRADWKSRMESTTNFEIYTQVLINHRTDYNLSHKLVCETGFKNCLAKLAELPDELFKDKDVFSNVMETIKNVKQEFVDGKLLYAVMHVFNLDKIKDEKDLSDYVKEESTSLKTQLQQLECISQYWDRTYSTFFFTSNKDHTMHLSTQMTTQQIIEQLNNVAFRGGNIAFRGGNIVFRGGNEAFRGGLKQISLPVDIIQHIVSYLNFGDIKIKRKNPALGNRNSFVKASLPKIAPILDRPKRKKGENAEPEANAQNLEQQSSAEHNLNRSHREPIGKRPRLLQPPQPQPQFNTDARAFLQTLAARMQAAHQTNMLQNYMTSISTAINPMSLFHPSAANLHQQPTIREEEMMSPEELFQATDDLFNLEQ